MEQQPSFFTGLLLFMLFYPIADHLTVAMDITVVLNRANVPLGIEFVNVSVWRHAVGAFVVFVEDISIMDYTDKVGIVVKNG